MFTQKHLFARVPTTDEDEALEYGTEAKSGGVRKSGSKSRPFLVRAALLLTLFLAALLGLFVVARLAPLSRTENDLLPAKWSTCGSDPATARSRGCSFDLISFAWQTPECFDGDLVSEFASWEGNWTFYADKKFTKPVSQEIAKVGERTPLYVKWDYHLVHCTFMWRQMHRAYESGWIDSHLGNYNHTLHCQKMVLMDEEASAKAVTMAQIIYPECLRTPTGTLEGSRYGDR